MAKYTKKQLESMTDKQLLDLASGITPQPIVGDFTKPTFSGQTLQGRNYDENDFGNF